MNPVVAISDYVRARSTTTLQRFGFLLAISLSPIGVPVLFLIFSVFGLCTPEGGGSLASVCYGSFFGSYIGNVGTLSTILLFGGPLVLIWWYPAARFWYRMLWYMYRLARQGNQVEVDQKENLRFESDIKMFAIIFTIALPVLLVLLIGEAS